MYYVEKILGDDIVINELSVVKETPKRLVVKETRCYKTRINKSDPWLFHDLSDAKEKAIELLDARIERVERRIANLTESKEMIERWDPE